MRISRKFTSGPLISSAGSEQAELYQNYADRIADAMAFMAAVGITPETAPVTRTVDFFTSHEGPAALPYEQALTRVDSLTGQWFGCSAHLLWVGERTRNPGEAHLEFARGINNPLAVKIGPRTEPDVLIELADMLNPDNEPGRLTFISRMGADQVGERLPPLLRKTRDEGRCVLWICDPMHGNTFKSTTGYKTRRLERICAEIRGFFDAHRAEGTHPGGIHLEMTGRDVTECVGGVQRISEENLGLRYHTHCDRAPERHTGPGGGIPGRRAPGQGPRRLGPAASRPDARRPAGDTGEALARIQGLAPSGASLYVGRLFRGSSVGRAIGC